MISEPSDDVTDMPSTRSLRELLIMPDITPISPGMANIAPMNIITHESNSTFVCMHISAMPAANKNRYVQKFDFLPIIFDCLLYYTSYDVNTYHAVLLQ